MIRCAGPNGHQVGLVSRLALYACLLPLAGSGGGSAGASIPGDCSAPFTVAGSPRSASPRSVVVSEGDSISLFCGGTHTAIYAAQHASLPFHSKAVGRSGITVRVGSTNGLVQRTDAVLALRPTVLTVLIGTNDLGDGTYASAEAWLDRLWAYVAVFKAQNIKVAVGTVLPICMPQMAAYNNIHAARRPIVNAAIRRAVGSKIDAVIDYAADPEIGPDAAACDTKWYGDGMHPTKYASGGQGVMARVYTRAVDDLIRR